MPKGNVNKNPNDPRAARSVRDIKNTMLSLVEREPFAQIRVEQILSEWIEDLMVGIENLVYIFDPERVVLGGGVSAQEKWLIKPLEERLHKKLMHAYQEHIRVLPATHLNDAGLIGAVYSFAEG